MLIIKSFEKVIAELLKEVVEVLVIKLEESIEEQICWLTDVLAFQSVLQNVKSDISYCPTRDCTNSI